MEGGWEKLKCGERTDISRSHIFHLSGARDDGFALCLGTKDLFGKVRGGALGNRFFFRILVHQAVFAVFCISRRSMEGETDGDGASLVVQLRVAFVGPAFRGLFAVST